VRSIDPYILANSLTFIKERHVRGESTARTAYQEVVPPGTTNALYPAHVLEKRYKSWNKVLDAAGVPINRSKCTPFEHFMEYAGKCNSEGLFLSPYGYAKAIGDPRKEVLMKRLSSQYPEARKAVEALWSDLGSLKESLMRILPSGCQ
jgi:hypothetical protein